MNDLPHSVDAILIVASSFTDANLYYATGFLAPDPFILLWSSQEKILLTNDLELNLAHNTARVDKVLPLSHYEDRARKNSASPTLADTVAELLQEKHIRQILVPANFPIDVADELRGKGFSLTYKKEPLLEQRLIKSEEEIISISATLRFAEEAMHAALDAIRKSSVRNGLLYLYDEILTSESLRRLIGLKLIEHDCVAPFTIVSCGEDACDPHNRGSGPLRANEPIVIDIFPQSMRTRYFADITRTVVKGSASLQLREMYSAVLAAQERAFEVLKPGIDGSDVHAEVMKVFEGRGFRTGMFGGRMHGCFHGTGHSLGLEIHEPLRIGKIRCILSRGNVVTIEPGLYYPGIGGVRIEDVVVIRDGAIENLTRFPKFLEVR